VERGNALRGWGRWSFRCSGRARKENRKVFVAVMGGLIRFSHLVNDVPPCSIELLEERDLKEKTRRA